MHESRYAGLMPHFSLHIALQHTTQNSSENDVMWAHNVYLLRTSVVKSIYTLRKFEATWLHDLNNDNNDDDNDDNDYDDNNDDNFEYWWWWFYCYSAFVVIAEHYLSTIPPLCFFPVLLSAVQLLNQVHQGFGMLGAECKTKDVAYLQVRPSFCLSNERTSTVRPRKKETHKWS